MRSLSIKNTLEALFLGLFILIGAAVSVQAQNTTEEYREWQRAQRQAQEEYQDYLRTRSPRDYRDWQQAQRRAQQEYNDYQRTNRNMRYNNRDNSGYNNRGQYRIYRNGQYYQVDSRGAELLRQAVNQGYQQGYRQGQMERRYGRGDNYYSNNSMYRTGTYGYQSYVDRSQYQYYFQQGFQRGYHDGYNSRTSYGYRSGNTLNILGSVLNTILNLSNN